MGEGAADYCHALIEATKEAFADRDKYLSDPDFVKNPLDYLLSAQHGKEQPLAYAWTRRLERRRPLSPRATPSGLASWTLKAMPFH